MKKHANKIQCLFVDPFVQSVALIETTCDLPDWHKLLRCETLSASTIAAGGDLPPIKEYEHINSLDIWYDDEFLFREPLLPAFAIFKGRNHFHGYALITATDRQGRTVDFDVSPIALPLVCRWLGMSFELYNLRFPNEEFIEEKMRSVDAELPEKCKTLAVCEASIPVKTL